MKTLFRHAGIIVNDVEKLKIFILKILNSKSCDIVGQKIFVNKGFKRKWNFKLLENFLEFIQFLKKKVGKLTQ